MAEHSDDRTSGMCFDFIGQARRQGHPGHRQGHRRSFAERYFTAWAMHPAIAKTGQVDVKPFANDVLVAAGLRRLLASR